MRSTASEPQDGPRRGVVPRGARGWIRAVVAAAAATAVFWIGVIVSLVLTIALKSPALAHEIGLSWVIAICGSLLAAGLVSAMIDPGSVLRSTLLFVSLKALSLSIHGVRMGYGASSYLPRVGLNFETALLAVFVGAPVALGAWIGTRARRARRPGREAST